MVNKKLAYSVKKAALPRYYKNCLYRSMKAWVGAYCEEISTGESQINTEMD